MGLARGITDVCVIRMHSAIKLSTTTKFALPIIFVDTIL